MEYPLKYYLLKYYDFLPDDYKKDLASYHNATVQSFQNELKKEVLLVDYLNNKQREWLVHEIKNMDEEMIDLLERTNHLSKSRLYTKLQERKDDK